MSWFDEMMDSIYGAAAAATEMAGDAAQTVMDTGEDMYYYVVDDDDDCECEDDEDDCECEDDEEDTSDEDDSDYDDVTQVESTDILSAACDSLGFGACPGLVPNLDENVDQGVFEEDE